MCAPDNFESWEGEREKELSSTEHISFSHGNSIFFLFRFFVSFSCCNTDKSLRISIYIRFVCESISCSAVTRFFLPHHFECLVCLATHLPHSDVRVLSSIYYIQLNCMHSNGGYGRWIREPNKQTHILFVCTCRVCVCSRTPMKMCTLVCAPCRCRNVTDFKLFRKMLLFAYCVPSPSFSTLVYLPYLTFEFERLQNIRARFVREPIYFKGFINQK